MAPNEDLITLIGGDDDDDEFDRDVDVSNVHDDGGGGDVGEVANEENALVSELKEELRRMDVLQDSLVREVVLRGR